MTSPISQILRPFLYICHNPSHVTLSICHKFPHFTYWTNSLLLNISTNNDFHETDNKITIHIQLIKLICPKIVTNFIRVDLNQK
jgi:hypothetical protein